MEIINRVGKGKKEKTIVECCFISVRSKDKGTRDLFGNSTVLIFGHPARRHNQVYLRCHNTIHLVLAVAALAAGKNASNAIEAGASAQ